MKEVVFLIYFGLVMTPLFSQDKGQNDPVMLESETEVDDEFIRELGFEWGIGTTISHFTNVDNPGQINVVGVSAFAGVDWLLHPVVSIFGHLNLTQFGNGTEFENGYNKLKFLNLGVDTGVKIHVKPGAKIDGFVLMGMDFGLNVSSVIKTKQSGDKDKIRTQLNDRENRGFAGATGGAGVTVRTDILDFTIQATVTGGLTLLDKNAPENIPRSVPFFAEIPIIIRYFGRKEQVERPNLIFFLEPQLIDSDEEF